MEAFLVSVPGQLLLIAGSMLLLALGTALQKRRLRQARPSRQTREPETAQPRTLTSAPQSPPAAPPWLHTLRDALHILIIGHSRGGKTTLIHALAVIRAAGVGEWVVVCDPDAAPGPWMGCEVVGYGNDFAAINAALEAVQREVAERRQLRGSGTRRQFAPLTLVIDEYADVTRSCPAARTLVEDVLRRGGKLGVRLILGVQDKQVGTMGFERAGDLRKNFSYVCEVVRGTDGTRRATLTDQDGAAAVWNLPTLPDPEALITPGIPPRPGREHAPDFPDKAAQQGQTSMGGMGDMSDMGAEEGGTGAGQDVGALLATIPPGLDERDRQIAGMLLLGLSGNAIHRALGGDRNAVLARVKTLKADLDGSG